MVLSCGCSCEEKMSFGSFDDSIMHMSTAEECGMDLLVTIPKGFREGNIIKVKSPFGTRTAEIVIPPGFRAGEKLKVTLPHPSLEPDIVESPNFAAAVENFVTRTPIVVGKIVDVDSFARLHSGSYDL